MSKDIPIGLQKKQAETRQRTLKKVQSAIDVLKVNGEIITKKKLIEITGLSASTFSKEHVKVLLQENEVCQFRPLTIVKPDMQALIQKHALAACDRKDREITALKQQLIKSEAAREGLQKRYNELKEKYQRLLGMYHELQRKNL